MRVRIKVMMKKNIFMNDKKSDCYFGSCASAAPNSTNLPSQGSFGYLAQSRLALLSTADTPESEILVRVRG
jgi:hypothetical protein